MQFVTLSQLSKMLYRGSIKIIEHKKEIDDINVFPVADSDTGSNLANTFLGIKEILENKGDSGVATPGARWYLATLPRMTIEAILESAFENSRGNSGMMMASYLKGFLKSLEDKSSTESVLDKNKISISDFAKAAENGFNAAKKSVEKPVNGTMLDVMKEFSALLFAEKKDISFIDVFYKATQKTKAALFNTEKKLKVLKENHVVDAGALGFTYFVFGLYEGLTSKNLNLDFRKSKPKIKKALINGASHEVIFVIQKTLFSITEIRKTFNSLGESLDIIEMEEKIKIHIHTDKPEVVRETAYLTGEVEEMEVVEMRVNR